MVQLQDSDSSQLRSCDGHRLFVLLQVSAVPTNVSCDLGLQIDDFPELDQSPRRHHQEHYARLGLCT